MGTNALQMISKKLQKELPGLRDFSAISLKKMRLFYENWIGLDCKSSVVTDDLGNVTRLIVCSPPLGTY